ncbi:MAG: UDP-N-acetylmuramoyl-L-alanine--D-glutamate ligase [Eubacteriaceae bacterium]|nr:UDP-N-acetylmuramoyl-L-alanine--D-glutamate ligase [Eubacteriaceae bacterium]
MLNYSNYLVLGAARSGIAVAKLLSERNKSVRVFDLKPLSELQKDGFGVETLESMPGVECCFGQNPEEADIRAADLIIASPGIPPSIPPFVYARSIGKGVVSEIELACSIFKGKYIAVTGTNGKTTTTSLLALLLVSAGFESYAAGNIGDAFINYADYPDSCILSLEISSFQLDETSNFEPDAAIITNITPDHLDRHITMENYINAKAKSYRNMKPGGLLIANMDDGNVALALQGAECEIAYFSTKQQQGASAWMQGGEIWLMHKGQKAFLAHEGELKIIGRHNCANAMCAALAALHMGASLESVRQGLLAFEPVEHRLEFVLEAAGVKYINDSKGTNTDATIIALASVNAPLIPILGGYDKHSEFDELAPLLKEKTRHAVVLGETKEKFAALLSSEGIPFTIAETFEDAVLLSSQLAQPGDTVLLSPACASWDMFDNYETRGRLFKQIVHNL